LFQYGKSEYADVFAGEVVFSTPVAVLMMTARLLPQSNSIAAKPTATEYFVALDIDNLRLLTSQRLQSGLHVAVRSDMAC
jgi:hypothetical protein